MPGADPGWWRLVAIALAAAGIGWRTILPSELGRVRLEKRSRSAAVAPVEFDHWRHRALFTCRVCHVDVGFAMAAGATGITAATNRAGYHCGACHDGKTVFSRGPLFAACSDAPGPADERCGRCHRERSAAQLSKEYEAFTANLPKSAAGHVDWEKAEAQGRIRLRDLVPSASVKRPSLSMSKDVNIAARGSWMSDIVFSHQKHAVWNGCEVCHPEIFPSTGAERARYSMLQIAAGEYCGACHEKVAVPIGECERCHRGRVR